MLSEAETLFDGTGINITTEGRKYLGGFVGKRTGEEDYVKDLVEDWVNQIEELSKIAKCEPQAAYSAFTAGFKHKMTYYMRTIPDLNEIMQPLDNVINNSFIPAITEEHILSPDDRKLLSLPARLGGMGIPIFSEVCTREYNSSLKATESLRPKIIAQDNRFILDKKSERQRDAAIRSDRNNEEKQMLDNLRSKMSPEQVRANDLAQLKGASAWLTALPLKDEWLCP